MVAFEVFSKLMLDMSDFENNLNSAEKEASGFGGKLSSAFSGAGKVALGTVTALGAGAAALTTGLIKGAGSVASYGDEIDKMSQKMGISAEAYQEWDAVLQHSGADISTLKASMKTMAKQAQGNAEEFQALGISMDEVATLSQEDLFSRVIEGLQGMEEGTERTAIASTLLGRGATELGALLNTSAEETQAMKDRVHELGGVMSDDAVKASAAFTDSMQDMTTAFGGLKRGLMSTFLPSITTVMDGLTELFSGDSEQGIAMVSNGIDQMVQDISDRIPEVMEVGSQIVLSLLTAISDNLPTLLGASADAITTIVTGLIENLPQIVSSGLDVIVSLADGIADSLPELIPTVVDVVIQIVTTLLNNSDKLISAALKLIIALGKGLIQAIPQLVSNIPQIIKAVVGALLEGVSQIRDVGKQLLEGLWNGINDKVTWLKGKVAGVVDKIKGWFTGSKGFDEHSPSKWAADVFEKLLEGGAKGLEEGEGGLLHSVQGVVGSVKEGLSPTMNMGFAGAGGYGSIGMPINITLIDEIDGAIFARKTFQYMMDEAHREGYAV